METGKRNYTAGDALQLLGDLGLEQQVPVLAFCFCQVLCPLGSAG